MPDKAGCAKTGGRAADLPAVDAWRAVVEVRHADSVPAQRRRAPQARTAEEIDAAARLSQMSAQLLRNDRIEPPDGAEGCRAVLMARGVERSLRSKAWCGHWAPPDLYSPPPCRRVSAVGVLDLAPDKSQLAELVAARLRGARRWTDALAAHESRPAAGRRAVGWWWPAPAS